MEISPGEMESSMDQNETGETHGNREFIYHLVMTNIAMENPQNKWKFLAGKIIYKWAIFHGYVK